MKCLRELRANHVHTTPTTCTFPDFPVDTCYFIVTAVIGENKTRQLQFCFSSHLNQMFTRSLVCGLDFGTTGTAKPPIVDFHKARMLYFALKKHFIGMCFPSNISCVLFNCHTERRSLWRLWF